MILIPHGAREVLDDVRIGDVAALGRQGHGQMMPDQPGDQSRIVLAESVVDAEIHGKLHSESRVIAASAFGDVMEEAGDVEQVWLGQLRENFRAAGHGLGPFR